MHARWAACLYWGPPTAAACRYAAGEVVLLNAFRDSLQLNFGDHGLGSALASMQGRISKYALGQVA
jgi:hypothetical protein